MVMMRSYELTKISTYCEKLAHPLVMAQRSDALAWQTEHSR